MLKRITLFIFLALPLFGINLKDLIISSQNAELATIKDQESLKSQLKKDSVKSEYMPSISIGGGYKYLAMDKFIINPKESLSGYAKLDFLIYDGGKREAILNSLSNLAKKESVNSDEFKNQLAFDITKLYFNALLIKDLINAKEAQKEYLQSEFRRLQSLKNAGLATDDEFSFILAKYHISHSDELSLKQDLSKLISSINLLSGVDDFELKFINFLEPDFSKKSESLQIKSLEFELLASKDSIKEQRALRLPNVFLQNKFLVHKSKFDEFAPLKPYADKFLGKSTKKSNEFILGFEWKIFSFGAISKKVQISHLTQTQIALNLNHKTRQNSIELKNLKNEIEILKQKIRSNELFLNHASSALYSTHKKYRAGLARHSDFLLALTNEFDAKSSLSASKTELEIKKAEYYLKSGIKIFTRINE